MIQNLSRPWSSSYSVRQEVQGHIARGDGKTKEEKSSLTCYLPISSCALTIQIQNIQCCKQAAHWDIQNKEASSFTS